MSYLRFVAAFAIAVLSTLDVKADSAQAFTPENSSASPVIVELALLKSNKIQLSYQLPFSCEKLPLRAPYSALQMDEMRKGWKSTNDCGSLVNGEIVRPDAQCGIVAFDVPVQATMADRVYPAAFPIGDLGVYAHTGIYAPTDACGPVTWRLKSDSGSVVYDGKVHDAEASVPTTDPEAAYMAVYLSKDVLIPGTTSVLSPELPSWIRDEVSKATSSVQSDYRQRFTSLAYTDPFVVGSAFHDQGPPRQQAEVAGGNLIRYAFFNPQNSPQPKDIADVRGVIAHEYGHKLQPESIRKVTGDPDNLIKEGGAEYLRWTSMVRLGWMSAADAQADLDKALNTCLAIIGEQSWVNVAGRSHGEAPYACGLTLHVLLLASRQDAQATTADSVLESFYRRSRTQSIDFGQALECDQATRCKARWAPALLSDTTHFASEMDRLIRSMKLASKRFKEAPSSLRLKIAGDALMHTMDDDCDGSRGFYTRKDGFEIGMSPECKTFRDGMLITQANGVGLMTEPLLAARKLAAQCADRHSAIFKTSGGGHITITCHSFAPPAAHFYELDIGKVLKRLGIATQ
jgi:hypothetical protein